MNFKEKRLAKKRAMQYFILAWIVGVTLPIYLIYTAVNVITTETVVTTPDYIVMSIIVLPIAGMLILAVIGQTYLSKRTHYLQTIKEYRTRIVFNKVIHLLRSGELEKGIDIYETMVKPNTIERKFLFGFIISTLLHSNDYRLVERGEKRMKIILDDYDPNKIVFN